MASEEQTLAETMADVADTFAQVLDVVIGYRTQCLANGFSETAAEAMAVELHATMLRSFVGGVRGES